MSRKSFNIPRLLYNILVGNFLLGIEETKSSLFKSNTLLLLYYSTYKIVNRYILL